MLPLEAWFGSAFMRFVGIAVFVSRMFYLINGAVLVAVRYVAVSCFTWPCGSTKIALYSYVNKA